MQKTPFVKVSCYDKTSVYDLVFLKRYYFSSLTVTGINKAQYIHLENFAFFCKTVAHLTK